MKDRDRISREDSGSGTVRAIEPLPRGSAGESLQMVLPSYRLIARIARGGMGTVYLARRAGAAGFQRLFAVKVMHEHLAESEEFVRMFLDEARIAARLHHPNVVPIVDVGESGGRQFVVMDYVEGVSLHEILRKSKESRPIPALLSIFHDFLLGLHAAHEMTDDDGEPLHLVHRDVSPQNVLVGADGSARIIDFGVAKAESRLTTTMPGVRKGKLAYMAPEQLQDTEVDRRADLFSAGAMLWSALTGEPLFKAENDAAMIKNLIELEVKPPSEVGLKPPAVFDAVCLKALERDPAKRYQTAADMVQALHEAAAQLGIVPTTADASRWIRQAAGQRLDDLRRQRSSLAREDDSITHTNPLLIDATPSRPSLAGALASSPSIAGASGVRQQSEKPAIEISTVEAPRVPRGVVAGGAIAGLALFFVGLIVLVSNMNEPEPVETGRTTTYEVQVPTTVQPPAPAAGEHAAAAATTEAARQAEAEREAREAAARAVRATPTTPTPIAGEEAAAQAGEEEDDALAESDEDDPQGTSRRRRAWRAPRAASAPAPAARAPEPAQSSAASEPTPTPTPSPSSPPSPRTPPPAAAAHEDESIEQNPYL
jgi:serine/threonine protein kinase